MFLDHRKEAGGQADFQSNRHHRLPESPCHDNTHCNLYPFSLMLSIREYRVLMLCIHFCDEERVRGEIGIIGMAEIRRQSEWNIHHIVHNLFMIQTRHHN